MMTREQLQACPRYGDHGLAEGCALCDPVRHGVGTVRTALAAEVADALALTEKRVEVEAMQLANDAALQRIAQKYRVGIAPIDVLNLRVAVLVEVLFGGMDDARRLDYEHAVQTKFTTIIADIEQQAARASLLNGVRIDPKNLP